MDDLLTPVSKTYTKPQIQEVSPEPSRHVGPKTTFTGSDPSEVIEVLKGQPDYDTLVAVLRYLSQSHKIPDSFSVLTPGPQSAQITQILVSEIAPNYWPLFKEDALLGDGARKGRDFRLFISTLRSLAGINAILVQLRALVQEAKSEQGGPKRPDLGLNVKIVLELFCEMLGGNETPKEICDRSLAWVKDPAKRRPLTQELVSLLAGGRVVSVAAEAQRVAGDSQASFWVADGQEYSRWLGKSIGYWTRQGSSEENIKLCADVFSRSLSLGYSHIITTKLFEELLFNKDGDIPAFAQLLQTLKTLDQRKVLFALLKHLTAEFLDKLDPREPRTSPIIPAAAALIDKVVSQDASRKSHLVSWLTSSSGAGIGDGIAVRRAALAALSKDKDTMATVLEKSVAQFGDELYVKHAPILQQEAHAQVLLLSAGYVHRQSPLKLSMLMRSRTYLSAISNRIAASQTKARFLGMAVGEALSSLVDTGDKRLNFHLEELNSDEAKWYKQLVKISDAVGSIEPLLSQANTSLASKPAPTFAPSRPKPRHKAKPVPSSKPKPVIEIVDDSDSDDIPALPKPDSDAEDSDDDPTLVVRNKPKAPVYIRDLILYLRDTENYDKQKLALTAAPLLIRRKANFGAEVAEHATELATLLVGLQDKFEMPDFYDLRLQGMVALVVAQPNTMAPWFARTFFEGDYNLSQRASVLGVLGLSGRELAGFEVSEYAAQTAFPSKKLPSKMEKLYLDDSTPTTSKTSTLKSLPPSSLDTIAHSLTASFLAPIAAQAADSVTGPSALKLSSFKQKTNPKPKLRAIPNTTANLLFSSFFAPLIARFQHLLRAPSSSSSSRKGPPTQPYLLALFIKTLSVLVHAAGPSTLSLREMTTEFWDLLLALRARAVGELAVLGALLGGVAVLLDVNEGDLRGVVERHGREVLETQEWVAGVMAGLRGGEGGGEENDVKMLAAGVLIRLHEVGEKYQRILMGEFVNS